MSHRVKGYIWALFCFFSLFSCEQESVDIPSNGNNQLKRLPTSLEEVTTSTQESNRIAILWSINDSIKVFNSENKEGCVFKSLNIIPSNNAEFEGNIDLSYLSPDNPLVAIYPSSTSASYDGTCLTTYLASEQVAIADGFEDHLLPSLAISTNSDLSFYQIATGICFTVATEGVKSVIFHGNKGEAVAGSFKVKMDSGGRPEVVEIVDGSQWVTIKAQNNGYFEVGKKYYLSVLPQEFEEGYTLTFLTDDKVARYELSDKIYLKRAIWMDGEIFEQRVSYTDRYLSNGLPTVEIIVKDGAPVESKENWLACNVRIGEDYYDTFFSGGKIRGRGNATWKDYPKKPYRIKFSSKETPFGFAANKDWVLLSEYNDHSFLRLPYMCEISKAAGAQYTVNYQHVNLYLNGEYRGLYVLTDQVKAGMHRVNLEDDGFLIEEDKYYDKEPLWFSTSFGLNFSFKYPDPGDGEIVSGDDKYLFITTFFSELETALSNILQVPEDVALRIDYSSFAKWFLIQELIGNWEPNRFYVLESRASKLKMYPAWDSEWSMGLAMNDNPNDPDGWYFPPTIPDNEAAIWHSKQYYPWLFKDPAFINVLKNEWILMKQQLCFVNERIDEVESEISLAQKDNFEKWPTLDKCYGAALIALGDWETEVDYVKNFFANRIIWMNNYIHNL